MAIEVERTISKWTSPWIDVSCHEDPPGSTSLSGQGKKDLKPHEKQNNPSQQIQEDVENDVFLEQQLPTLVVEVPDTGWYAFYFGFDEPFVVPKRKKQSKKQKITDQREIDHLRAKSPSITGHFLSIISAVDHGGEQIRQRKKIPLPLREGDFHLTSCRIGKLIFLTKGAQVQVNKEFGSTKAAINTQPVRWRISFHRLFGFVTKDEVPSNEKKKERSVQQPDLGAESGPPNRSFSCSVCGLCFHNCNAVQQHMSVLHDPSAFHSTYKKDGTTLEDRLEDDRTLWIRPLTVLYQDDALAVIDKPQGMPVMGSEQTLQRSPLLLPLKGTRIPEWSTQSTTAELVTVPDSILGKPRPVHRLDGPTGGVLVLAKTYRSEALLKQMFRERTCHKVYRAVVYGRLAAGGLCEEPISGKPATTRYHPLRHSRSIMSQDQWFTVVELIPVTGRRHQLRKHLQHLSHPIVGDRKYGGGFKIYCPLQESIQPPPHLQRLCLWAMKITFPHPCTGEEIVVSLPQEPSWIQHVTEQEELFWKEKHDSTALN